MNPKEGGSFAEFEQLFSVRDIDFIPGGEILDVSLPQPDGVIYFSPGWNAAINDYKRPIAQLYCDNRRVISAQASGDENKKVDIINYILDTKRVARADFIGHSVGAISTVLAAERSQIAVGKVILLNPPSMIGTDTQTDLIKRYKELMRDEGNDTNGRQNTVSRKAFFEMASTITEFDMYSRILNLKKNGVDVITVHCANDRLFPAGRVIREASHRGWENFVIEPGGHMHIDDLTNKAIQYLKH